MEKQTIKNEIVSIVEGGNGIKATELATIPSLVLMASKENIELLDLFEELVCEEKIVEVEYTVPSLPNRLKSFYLPKGSIITAVSGDFS